MALKKSYWAWVAVFAFLLVAGMLLAGIVSEWTGKPAMAAEDAQGKRTITVNGSGEVEVEPDIAYISFGLMTRADTADKAQQENARIFAEVEKVLKETYKINPKEIRTTGFYVHPEYRYVEREEPKISGYTARHVVEVTFRDLDHVGSLLDAVSKAGANEINNVRFEVENVDALKTTALELALKNARGKAEALAKVENVSIKGVLHISESGGYYSPFYGSGVAELTMKAADSAASTVISSGTVKVQAQVTVQYEF